MQSTQTRRLYAGTGLSTGSCQSIMAHAVAHRPELSRLLADSDLGDRSEIVDLLVDGLTGVREMEPRSELAVDSRELLNLWLDGTSVHEIARTLEIDDAQDATEYIEDVFSYRLPWGISSYVRLASVATGVDQLTLLSGNIAGMVKYGVPTPEAAWAMTSGVASRRASIVVARTYLQARRTVRQGFSPMARTARYEHVARRLRAHRRRPRINGACGPSGTTE